MENNQENVVVENQGTTEQQQIDFAGLKNALEKGLAQKENAVINGYLKSLGLDESEAKIAAEQFKQNRQKEEEEKRANADNLMNELNAVKEELKKVKTEKFVSNIGEELGLNTRSIEAALKLGSFENTEDVDKIKTSFNDFLEKYPEFKPVNTQNGKIVEIGSPEGEEIKKVGDDDLLKAFNMTEEDFKKYKRK